MQEDLLEELPGPELSINPEAMSAWFLFSNSQPLSPMACSDHFELTGVKR